MSNPVTANGSDIIVIFVASAGNSIAEPEPAVATASHAPPMHPNFTLL